MAAVEGFGRVEQGNQETRQGAITTPNTRIVHADADAGHSLASADSAANHAQPRLADIFTITSQQWTHDEEQQSVHTVSLDPINYHSRPSALFIYNAPWAQASNRQRLRCSLALDGSITCYAMKKGISNKETRSGVDGKKGGARSAN
jgi:hypothetical protein